MTLPDLGVGLIYLPGLEPLLEASQDLLDVIEIEPQTFWFRTSAGYAQRDGVMSLVERMPQAKLVHGVGFPVGGTVRPDRSALLPFANTVRRLSSPWCSEHLSFNRVSDGSTEFDTVFLLPPVQTAEAATLAADNIRRLQRMLPVPFAFETGVNYLRPRPGELSDGRFFAAVAEQADCGILLDLHNLWCNERNGRQPVREVLAELPLDRVWEVHLAGGQELDGYWLDAHSGPVPEPLADLAAEVIPVLPNLHAVVFEMIPEYLTTGRTTIAQLVDQLGRIREMWMSRSSRPVEAAPTATAPATVAASAAVADERSPGPAEWELALGSAVLGNNRGGGERNALVDSLVADPGTRVIRRVVDQVRAGTVVDTLRYTFRLIVLHSGEDRFRELFTAFSARTPPRMFGADEAAAFAAFLCEHAADIPYLRNLVDFELAVHRAEGEAALQVVQFGCDPTALLTALGEGRLPQKVAPGDYEVLVPPTAPQGDP